MLTCLPNGTMPKFVWKRGFNSEREGWFGGQEMGRNPQQKTQAQQCSLGLGRHELNSDDTLKNFALWSHKCPHVQSLCMCMSTCEPKLTWGVCCTDSSKDIYSKLLYGTWQCVYVCIVCTQVHTYVL